MMAYPSLPLDRGDACSTLPDAEKALFSGSYNEQVYAQRRYCSGCPIRQACLDLALALPPEATRNTVWGGFTPTQRQSIRNGATLLPPSPLTEDDGPPPQRGKRPVSRYRGVQFFRNHWRVQIKVNGKSMHLGVFPLSSLGEREAAKLYDQAAWNAWGEKATLNFRREETGDERAGIQQGSTGAHSRREAASPGEAVGLVLPAVHD